MSDQRPGRTCPLRYRYGAESLAGMTPQRVRTLYVVGGLYGNLQALDAIERIAAQEPGGAMIIFNGDFNWFNVDDAGFREVNTRVLRHSAIAGNVEAELGAMNNSAGCGCGYPEHVDQAVVERSNLIHARLDETARRHPELLAQLSELPMKSRIAVGACRIAVVHGDADALAGWRFDVSALDDADNAAWVERAFERAAVDVFACTHTCLPAMRVFQNGVVVNNGAAGMPNFHGCRYGLITRIGVTPAPVQPLYEAHYAGVRISAIAVDYDHERWQAAFLRNWQAGSPAWLSYFDRIAHGPHHALWRAYPAAD